MNPQNVLHKYRIGVFFTLLTAMLFSLASSAFAQSAYDWGTWTPGPLRSQPKFVWNSDGTYTAQSPSIFSATWANGAHSGTMTTTQPDGWAMIVNPDVVWGGSDDGPQPPNGIYGSSTALLGLTPNVVTQSIAVSGGISPDMVVGFYDVIPRYIRLVAYDQSGTPVSLSGVYTAFQNCTSYRANNPLTLNADGTFSGAITPVSGGTIDSCYTGFAGFAPSIVRIDILSTRPAQNGGRAQFGDGFSAYLGSIQQSSLTINKTVNIALPQAATFNFTISCTHPTAGVTPIAAADANPSIAMPIGATTGSVTVSRITAGSTCSVTEAAPAAITNYAWGTTPAPVTGVAVNNDANANAGFTNVLTPLDPPFISKRARMLDGTTVEWTITVANNSITNAAQGPVAFTVTDVLPAGFAYTAGTLSCTPTGTASQTTVATCGFNAGNTTLNVTGTLAYTASTTVATAGQRVDIVFRGNVALGAVVPNTACTNLTGQTANRCNSAAASGGPLPVPGLDGKGLALVMLMLGFMGIAAQRRTIKAARRNGAPSPRDGR